MKRIQRTDSLKNPKTLSDGTQVLYESAPGGMRKIRCPKCQASFAVPTRAANGKQVYRCTCGAQFTSTPLR